MPSPSSRIGPDRALDQRRRRVEAGPLGLEASDEAVQPAHDVVRSRPPAAAGQIVTSGLNQQETCSRRRGLAWSSRRARRAGSSLGLRSAAVRGWSNTRASPAALSGVVPVPISRPTLGTGEGEADIGRGQDRAQAPRWCRAWSRSAAAPRWPRSWRRSRRCPRRRGRPAAPAPARPRPRAAARPEPASSRRLERVDAGRVDQHRLSPAPARRWRRPVPPGPSTTDGVSRSGCSSGSSWLTPPARPLSVVKMRAACPATRAWAASRATASGLAGAGRADQWPAAEPAAGSAATKRKRAPSAWASGGGGLEGLDAPGLRAKRLRQRGRGAVVGETGRHAPRGPSATRRVGAARSRSSAADLDGGGEPDAVRQLVAAPG